MVDDSQSEYITLADMEEVVAADQYYSEPEILEYIFKIPTPPLSDDVKQDIKNSCAKRGGPAPSLESLTPTNMTASGIINHLVNAGLPYIYNTQGMAFDQEEIRVFFREHDIALPWQLFPNSQLNSKRKMIQLLDQREMNAPLLQNARVRQQERDEQDERELRHWQLEKARARAERVKTGSISSISDGCINVYEDTDLRHEFLIRIGVLEKLSTELGSGFEKGDELENAQQQLWAIIDTINKKPSAYRDDSLKEEIKRYIDCWLSADDTTPEYAILQHRLSQWRAKYLSEQSVAAQVGKPINNPPAAKMEKRKYTRGGISQEDAAKLCGVGLRTLQNWDKGIRRPDRYPGRGDAAAFSMFASEYQNAKRFSKAARAVDRAGSLTNAKIDLERSDTTGNPWE